jgi:signal transduction histidine kinase
VSWLETRRLPTLFAAATLLPIAVLCWLGVRTLDQDRDLERQRRRERLEVAAGRVALDIEQDLQRLESQLSEGDGIRFLPAQIVIPDNAPLLYRPEAPSVNVRWSAQLAAAAQQEDSDPSEAIRMYSRIADARDDPDRGEALVALGALLRRQRRIDEALHAYGELEMLGAATVAGGQPAALVARQGRAKTFLESGDKARLRDEAVAFAHALRTGGWLIDRASFELYQHEMIEPWGGPAADPGAVQRADAVAGLWHQWRRGELEARGRRFVGSDPATLAIWVRAQGAPVIAVLTVNELVARWRPIWGSQGLTAAVARTDGRPVFGAADAGLTLTPNDTRLPFMLSVAGGPVGLAGEDTFRRRLVIGGIALACLLMSAASYGLYRVTTRELLLARQQSDFVAAVSHEFRTPLTSMRHLLDLLIGRGVVDEGRKAHYYTLLAGETERLQRMVETLLSFGRMDAAAHVWKLEPLEVTDLVHSVADDFRREIAPRLLDVELNADLPGVRGDREALARALWNLLENAAKYSPGESPIRLFAERAGTTVAIGVQDHGIGIPVAEQQRVFQKFVRGDDAKRAGIRGVGVGLALVKRVAEAHGGTVGLTSAVGAGSTFTLVLPGVNVHRSAHHSQTAAAG